MASLSLYLVGRGGNCKSVVDVLELCGNYTILGIVDTASRLGEKVLGYPVVATDD